MAQTLHNNVTGILSASVDSVSTSIFLVDGSVFPDPGSDYYLITLVYTDPATNSESAWEVLKVTGKPSTNELIVARGQEGTSPRAFSAGDRVEARITAATVVTPDGAQTLTNKTISGGTLENVTINGGTPGDAVFANVTADSIALDTTATSARQPGRIRWNATAGTIEADLAGSAVTLQVGQERVFRVYNSEATSLQNGEVVYFFSAVNDEVMAVKRFIADGTIDYELPVAITTESIAAGGYGYITFSGMVRGLDTSGLSTGDTLYASNTTPGAYIVGHPPAPAYPVHIGTVVNNDVSNGVIYTNVWGHTPADESVYNNSNSELLAHSVQAAIDELDVKKADVSLLQANLTFYPTTAASPVSGYSRLVTSTDDASYDDPAVDVSTGTITSADTLIASLASDEGVLDGTISAISLTTVGAVRRTSGNSMGRFWFEIYKRTSGGTETLIATSGKTSYTDVEEYTQFFEAAYIATTVFGATDRLVTKYYGNTDGSNAVFDFRFGGTEPIRSLLPVPVNVIPSVTSAGAITADTSAFTGILSGTDTTVQAALDTIDDHGHGIGDINLLETELASKVDKATTVTGVNGLTGGGDLSANRTISHADTSTAIDLTASSRTYVDSLDFDDFGHVVGYTTSTETVVDNDTITRIGVAGAGYISGDIDFVGTNQASVSKTDNTVTIDVSVTDSNNYVNSVSFSDSTGVLTLNRQGLSALTVDLDGRYLESFTEADPTVPGHVKTISTTDISNWNNAYGDKINAATFNTGTLTLTRQDGGTVTVSLDGRYLQSFTETDTLDSVTDRGNVTTNSISVGVVTATGGNSTNWNSAYGWGDHASAGYLPQNTANYGGTYNIPVVVSGQLYFNPTGGGVTITGSNGQITTPSHGNSSQWNTAYGWGNHASAGYLSTSTELDDLARMHVSDGSSSQDPNTTAKAWFLTNHANGPNTGHYYHVQQWFWSGKTTSTNRAQLAIQYNGGNRMFVRSYYTGWGAWQEIVQNTGTWGISITGNAATATTATWADTVDVNSGQSSQTTYYDVVWHSGDTVYSTPAVDIQPSSGTLRATSFSGSGAGLTSLNATNISSGTINDARLPATITSNITGSSASCTGNAATATTASNAAVTTAGNGWYDILAHSGGAFYADTACHIHGSGYIQASYFNNTHGVTTRNSDTQFYTGTTDGYIRANNAAGTRTSMNVPTRTGGDASGTWGISITGNAATASQVSHNHSRTDSASYPVIWGTATAHSPAYSCAAVTIQSSTGKLRATQLEVAGCGALRESPARSGIVSVIDNGDSWTGLGIEQAGRYWQWMADSSNHIGLYEDNINHWMIYATALGGVDLYHNGTSRLSTTSAGVSVNGSFTASSNVTAYSDERLKDNIETLDGSKVYEMRGVSFTKDGEASSGVIAQELQKVAPELVQDDGEYLSVAYGNLVGYLIEAVKELKAEIDELKGAK